MQREIMPFWERERERERENVQPINFSSTLVTAKYAPNNPIIDTQTDTNNHISKPHSYKKIIYRKRKQLKEKKNLQTYKKNEKTNSFFPVFFFIPLGSAG